MAVYTIVDPIELQDLLLHYDIGNLISCKGIAEGVENSNYFIETDQQKYVLTLYENRVNEDDLPFFFDLLDHLHKANIPVPRFISAKDGSILQKLAGRPACIIEFLPGISLLEPNSDTARSMGKKLAEMHSALKNYTGSRPNNMGLTSWRSLAEQCTKKQIDNIDNMLYSRIVDELEYLNQNWPKHLPQSVVHADLFPDNVLLTGNNITGIIDFYFSATDIRDYDIAVTHAAWCFSPDGKIFHPDISDALLGAYNEILPLNSASFKGLPTLLRGASMRFLLSRTVDWINTPKDALVTRKDPIAFLHRLDFYSDNRNINQILDFR